jgi:hypothetical protein
MTQPNSAESIYLNLTVRDYKFRVCVGLGAQNFFWLASVAVHNYTSLHKQYCDAQFSPVAVVDASNHNVACFPNEIINEKCLNNADIDVQIVGPSSAAASAQERGLWWLYAYTPPSQFQSIIFIFDGVKAGIYQKTPQLNTKLLSQIHPDNAEAIEEALTQLSFHTNFGSNLYSTESSAPQTAQAHKIPAIYGNFNNWSNPVPLSPVQGSPGKFKIALNLPLSASLVFKFALISLENAHSSELDNVLGPDYPVFTGENGEKFHCFTVAQQKDAAFFNNHGEITANTHRETGIHTIDRLLGNFKPTNRILLPEAYSQQAKLPNLLLSSSLSRVLTKISNSAAIQQRLFRYDSINFNFSDILQQNQVEASQITALLAEVSPKLSEIYKFHCGYTIPSSNNIRGLNLLNFLIFCRVSRLLDGRTTASRLYRIFHTVKKGQSNSAATTGTHQEFSRNHSLYTADVWNQCNLLSRREFYESLVRIAVLKWPNEGVQEGLAQLINNFVVKNYCAGRNKYNFSLDLIGSDVNSVFSEFSNELYNIFDHFAAKNDRSSVKSMSIREFDRFLSENMLLDGRLERNSALSAFTSLAEENSQPNSSQKVSNQHHARNNSLFSFNAAEPNAEENNPLNNAYSIIYAEFLELLARIATMREAEGAELSSQLYSLLKHLFPSSAERSARIAAKEAAILAAAEAAAAQQAAIDKANRIAAAQAKKAAAVAAAREAEIANNPKLRAQAARAAKMKK